MSKHARRWLPLIALALAPSLRAEVTPPADVAARLHVLRAEIHHHDDLYFRQAAPEIADADYDQLTRELAQLEKNYPSASPPSSEQAPADDRGGSFPLVRHRAPMLSLDKSYSETELRAFHARLARELGDPAVACVVEPKFDGIAISITYENGQLRRAVTRGDGHEGEDITAHILAIPSLPHQLRPTAADRSANAIPALVELRGEIYLPLAEFARLNREREAAGESPLTHPRTAAAGTLKQHDPGMVAERGLAVVFHGWGAWLPAASEPQTQHAYHALIQQWGLPEVENFRVTQSADELWSAVQAFGHVRASGQFPAPTDGAVAKLDSVPDRARFGASAHAPRWAMAYKFATEQAKTQLKAITFQVGRTGVLTPVAELAPVKLGGVTISRASLHNVDEIVRRDFRIGDSVTVEKAGEVIPAIVSIDLAARGPDSAPYAIPTQCPVCHTDVAREAGDAAIYCPNRECPARVQRELEHFVSSNCVNIPGLGSAAIELLVTRGTLKSIPDIYRLRVEDLLNHVAGFGSLQACERLLAAIARSKGAELWRVVYGLGIPHIGVVAAKDVARRYGGLEALAKAGMAEASGSSGTGTGLSPREAKALSDYFNDEGNCTLVANLVALGVRPKVTGEDPAVAQKPERKKAAVRASPGSTAARRRRNYFSGQRSHRRSHPWAMLA